MHKKDIKLIIGAGLVYLIFTYLLRLFLPQINPIIKDVLSIIVGVLLLIKIMKLN